MSKSKNLCIYKYGRGVKNGELCNKKCFGEYCSKHKRNIKTETPKDEIKMEDIEMFNENEMDEDEETVYEESIIPTVKRSNTKSTRNKTKKSESDDILITKYFVHDCIREFFRDHNEINDILGKKTSSSSSSSNMTSIMGMAGISLIPFLMRNLSNMNINDAIHKQGFTGEIRSTDRSNTESERETRNNYGKFEISESIKEKLRSEIAENEGRDSSTSERVLENIKRNTKV